jgi:glycosyltransferase involved in cell wall biosynthesis
MKPIALWLSSEAWTAISTDVLDLELENEPAAGRLATIVLGDSPAPAAFDTFRLRAQAYGWEIERVERVLRPTPESRVRQKVLSLLHQWEPELAVAKYRVRLRRVTAAKAPSTEYRTWGSRLSVVTRFHDPTRATLLVDCVRSIADQTYPDIEHIVVAQELGDNERQRIDAILPRAVKWVALEGLGPGDHRSLAANRGIERATGRYLMFLDFDDTLEPDACEFLVRRLETTGAGVATGRIVKRIEEKTADGHWVLLEEQDPFRDGKSIIELIAGNFLPIHSYVIDRMRVPAHALRFREELSLQEDYEFLLRLLTVAEFDFEERQRRIGTYRLRTDGSNTMVLNAAEPRFQEWVDAERKMRALTDPLIVGLTTREIFEVFGVFRNKLSRAEAIQHQPLVREAIRATQFLERHPALARPIFALLVFFKRLIHRFLRPRSMETTAPTGA